MKKLTAIALRLIVPLDMRCRLLRMVITFMVIALLSSCVTDDFYCHTNRDVEVEAYTHFLGANKKVTILPTDTLIIEKSYGKLGYLELSVPKYDRYVHIYECDLVSMDGTPISEVMAGWEKRDAWEMVFGPEALFIKNIESYIKTKYGLKVNWKFMLCLAVLIYVLTAMGKSFDKEAWVWGKRTMALLLMLPTLIYSYLLIYHMSDITFSSPDDWSFWQKVGYYVMEIAEIAAVGQSYLFISESLGSVSTSDIGYDFGVIALAIWMICCGWFDQLYATQMYYIFYGILAVSLLADLIYHIKHPMSIILAMLATAFTFYNIVFIAFVQILLFLARCLVTAGTETLASAPGAVVGGFVDSATSAGPSNDYEDVMYADGKTFVKHKGDDHYYNDGKAYDRSGSTLSNNVSGEDYEAH